ncbi:MAG: AAA family ATPase [bacterium]|nr:AAA family ATPase [bacterium]
MQGVYNEYWGITEEPFKNVPDPRFFYRSESHEEALIRLQYLVNGEKGCGILFGGFGCGKTVVLNALTDEFKNTGRKFAYISNPLMDNIELLREIVYRLTGDSAPYKKSDVLHTLEKLLIDSILNGKNTVIIIDEAHTIDDDAVFEECRLFLNMYYENRQLLTLLLSGQPEIIKTIDRLKSLAQRITLRCSISKFNYTDTQNYIRYRLGIVGLKREIFTNDAINEIYNYSDGIPRRINTVCDLSLLSGFFNKVKMIDKDIVSDVVKDRAE